MNMSVVFWVVTPCRPSLVGGYHFHPEDRGDRWTVNVGNHRKNYTENKVASTPKHRANKTYREQWGPAARILDFGNFIYLRFRIRGWVNPRTGLDAVGRDKSLPLLGIQALQFSP
jgi:hypothetical protein